MGWTWAGCPVGLRWGWTGRCHQDFAELRKKKVLVSKQSFWCCRCPRGHSFIPSKACFQQTPLNHHLVLREVGRGDLLCVQPLSPRDLNPALMAGLGPDPLSG